MWDRKALKERAKIVLKNTLVTSLLVAFVLLIVASGGSRGATVQINDRFDNNAFFGGNTFYDVINGSSRHGYRMSASRMADMCKTVLGPVLFFALIGIAIASIFIHIIAGNPLRVGGYSYFLRTAEGKNESASALLFSFKEGRYGNAVVTMFLTQLYTFLWSLLLVIPGIIKTYAYRMVPFILADNPHMSSKRAIELSQNMMRGEKMETFILDLSFVGWTFAAGIVSVIIPFVGWVAAGSTLNAYQMATGAQLYMALRDKAINSGLTSAVELNVQTVFIQPTPGVQTNEPYDYH